MLDDFDPALKTKAQTVFIGEAVRLVRVDDETVVIDFKVEKTLQGEDKAGWKVIYRGNTNVGAPESLQELISLYGKKVEIGIIVPQKSYEDSLQLYVPSGFQNRPVVVQWHCNPPYILPVSPVEK